MNNFGLAVLVSIVIGILWSINDRLCEIIQLLTSN